MTRRKTTESEKKIKGTWRADRAREKPEQNTEGADVASLAPPDHVSDEVRAVWMQALASAPNKILKPCDLGTFEVWCENFVMFRAASAMLRQQSPVITTATGYQQPNQWFTIQQKSSATMARMANSLGFDPASRNRMGEVTAPAAAEHEQEDWFWFVVDGFFKDSPERTGMFENLGIPDTYPECKHKRYPKDDLRSVHRQNGSTH